MVRWETTFLGTTLFLGGFVFVWCGLRLDIMGSMVQELRGRGTFCKEGSFDH